MIIVFLLDSQGLLKSAGIGKIAHAPILGYDKHSIREPLASVFSHRQKYAVNKQANAHLAQSSFVCADFLAMNLLAKKWFLVPEVPAEVASPVAEQDYIVALHATSQDEKLWPEDHLVDAF